MLGESALRNRVAVVTGGDQEVGHAIAMALAQAGARVALICDSGCEPTTRPPSPKVESAAQVATCRVDITSESGVEALEAFLEAGDYDVDILINGMSHTGRPLAASCIPDADWMQSFTVNVLTPYRMARVLGSKMRARAGGSIVNVFGGSGFASDNTRVPLSATSAALWTVTQALSTEFAPFVRVNAVCAGARFDGNEIGHLSPAPAGAEGGPDDLAGAILYLVDDNTSTTTGAMLTVGRTAGRPS